MRRIPKKIIQYILPVSILIAAGFLYAQKLGDPYIHAWDESVHVNVVKNISEDCCTPKLHHSDLGTWIEDWSNNYIWLHKPLLPFYMQAGFYKLFGSTMFAFRFPGALLALLTAWLLFIISKKHASYAAGVIAMMLFLFSPYVYMQVVGIEFSGFPDIMLVCMQTLLLLLLLKYYDNQKMETVIGLGFLFSVAYLTKSGLGLIMLPLVCVIMLMKKKLRGIADMAAMGLVMAPLPLFEHSLLANFFPREFFYEQAQHIKHIFTNVEKWQRPWDYYLTSYSYRLFGFLTIPFLYFVPATIKKRPYHVMLIVLLLLYIIPLSFFVSKINNFIFPIIIPACLLFGSFLGEIIEQRKYAQAWFIAAASAVVVSLVSTAQIYDLYPKLKLIDEQSIRLDWLLSALFIAAVTYVVFIFIKKIKLQNHVATSVAVSLVVIGITWANVSSIVKLSKVVRPFEKEQAQMRKLNAENLPKNALVIINDKSFENAHLYFTYWTGIDALWAEKMPLKLNFSGPIYILNNGNITK